MIRAIDFQKVEMTDAEFEYYKELIQKFTTDSFKGAEYFHDLFVTDDGGNITLIKPTKSLPWDIMFFVQNLMINQHLRELDTRMARLERSAP